MLTRGVHSSKQTHYGSVGRDEESDPLVRSAESEEGDYDIVVVGTGIGAAGFIRRLKQFDHTKDFRILWLEEGTRFSALSWPAALVTASNEGRIPQFPVTSQDYLWALSWKAFGGGDALNSGGPNYLGIQRGPDGEPIPDIDPPPLPPFPNGASAGNVFDLRNNSVHPPTPLGDRFIKGFQDIGWKVEPAVLPATSNTTNQNCVGYPSSIYALDHQSRMLIADELTPGKPLGVTAIKLGYKVKRVLYDAEGDKKRACGVAAVDLESGKEVNFRARKVVLAAGVFGTFDVLLNSGIGPLEYLEMRNVTPVHPNPLVGTSVGDESQITVLFLPAEKQPPPPPDGQQQCLVGWKSESGKLAACVWSSGLPALFTIYTRTKLTDMIRKIPFLRLVANCFKAFFRVVINVLFAPYGFVGVSMDTPATRRVLIKKEDPGQVVYDDDSIEFTDEMLTDYNKALPGLKNAFEANEKEYGLFGRLVPRLVLRFLTPLLRYVIGGRFQEGALTQYKMKPRQLKEELASYQHYYGGCGDGVVDDTYAVEGVQDLHVCDATVITKFGCKLLPGAPSTTIMLQGMRVADAMYPRE